MRPRATISYRSAPFEPSASLFSVGSPLIRNRLPRECERPTRAPALLRSSPTTKSKPKLRLPGFEELPGGRDHGGDDALGIAGAAAPDEVAIFAGRDERRDGIHVGGKYDNRVAEADKNVVALLLYRHFFNGAIELRRKAL